MTGKEFYIKNVIESFSDEEKKDLKALIVCIAAVALIKLAAFAGIIWLIIWGIKKIFC